MSFVAKALGFGGRVNVGERAAQAQAQGNQQAIAELRRQFGITQENIQPFLQAGIEALPQVQEGTTAGGLDERLGRILGTDVFQNLLGERTRAVQGQLAATGQARSGFGLQEAARIPTELGLGLEELLTGRSRQLAGAGQAAAVGLGQFGAQTAGGIADLFRRTGQATGAGIVTDAQAEASRAQQQLSTVATIGSIFFSDPSLKENIEQIGEIKGLNLYQWDWISKTKDTLIEKCPDMGFMADEVKEMFPDLVSEFCGFLVIDYPSLLDKLEAA